MEYAGWPGPYPHVCSTWQRAATWAATGENCLCSHNVVSRSGLSRSRTAEWGHLAPWSPSALCGTSYPHAPKRHGVKGRIGWDLRNGKIKILRRRVEEEKVWGVNNEQQLSRNNHKMAGEPQSSQLTTHPQVQKLFKKFKFIFGHMGDLKKGSLFTPMMRCEMFWQDL